MRLLTVIKKSPVGAQAVVDADVFIDVRELLESSSQWDWMSAAEILVATFATHDFGLKLILNSNLCTPLVSLLRRVRFPVPGLEAHDRAAMARTMSS